MNKNKKILKLLNEVISMIKSLDNDKFYVYKLYYYLPNIKNEYYMGGCNSYYGKYDLMYIFDNQIKKLFKIKTWEGYITFLGTFNDFKEKYKIVREVYSIEILNQYVIVEFFNYSTFKEVILKIKNIPSELQKYEYRFIDIFGEVYTFSNYQKLKNYILFYNY